MGSSNSKSQAFKEHLFYICFIGGTVSDFDKYVLHYKNAIKEEDNKVDINSFKLSSLIHDFSKCNLLEAACCYSEYNTANRIELIKHLLLSSSSNGGFNINEQRPENGNCTALMYACNLHMRAQSTDPGKNKLIRLPPCFYADGRQQVENENEI